MILLPGAAPDLRITRSYDGDYYDYGQDDDRDDGNYDAGEASDGYYSDDNYGSYYNYYSD